MDDLADKYKFDLAHIRTPPQFLGCVANFVFLTHYHYTDTLAHISGVYKTIGIHPKYSQVMHQWVNFVQAKASFPDFLAIGEIGLDQMHGTKKHNPVPMNLQVDNFEFHLLLAGDLKKPIVLHSRGTVKECLDLCRLRLPDPTTHKIHLHCFTGNVADLDPYLHHMINLKIGITNALWSNSKVQNTVCTLPLEQLLLETDAPHFADHVGFTFSTALHALNVGFRISQLCSEPLSKVLRVTTDNTRFIYGF